MTPFVDDPDFTLYLGDVLDVLKELPDGCVDCVVTSPPYGDARADSPAVAEWMWPSIFAELGRVVAGGMLWNVGRVWRGGIERLWWLDLIRDASFSEWEHWDTRVWAKPNANPIHGRLFADSHEYVLAFGRDGVRFNIDAARTEYAPSTRARLGRAWTNHRGVKNPDESKARKTTRAEPNILGARPRSYVEICVGREKGNPHPTPMAAELAEDLVELACWEGQIVLDPFAGSGTTAIAARKHGRKSVGIELNEEYARLAARRLGQQSLLAEGAA